jgi:hypothetical protein
LYIGLATVVAELVLLKRLDDEIQIVAPRRTYLLPHLMLVKTLTNLLEHLRVRITSGARFRILLDHANGRRESLVVALLSELALDQGREHDSIWLDSLALHPFKEFLSFFDHVMRDKSLDQARVNNQAWLDTDCFHLIKEPNCTCEISLARKDLDQDAIGDI